MWFRKLIRFGFGPSRAKIIRPSRQIANLQTETSPPSPFFSPHSRSMGEIMTTNHSIDTSDSGFTLNMTSVSRDSGLLSRRGNISSTDDELMFDWRRQIVWNDCVSLARESAFGLDQSVSSLAAPTRRRMTFVTTSLLWNQV